MHFCKSIDSHAALQSVPVLEEILQTWSALICADFDGYRGHCYRVLNFYAALAPNSVCCPEKIAIATAFHDIGIWTHQTFDYLEPSVDLAVRYLTRHAKDDWIQDVQLLIREHHRIRPVPGPADSPAEVFRRADWIDVSGGLLTFGLPRQRIREAYTIWPSAGFHRRLLQLTWRRFERHPLSPFPMLKL